jgi:hypothetical protein
MVALLLVLPPLLAIAGLPLWPNAGGHSAEPVLSNTSQPTDLKSSR